MDPQERLNNYLNSFFKHQKVLKKIENEMTIVLLLL